VRITAAVEEAAADRIVGSTRGSNAKPQFRATAECARETNGTAALTGTRAGVSVIRSSRGDAAT
jgi:hypothetical protein